VGFGIDFHLSLQKPERDEWESGLVACQAALDLERHVNQALLDLHKVADTHNDPQVRGYISRNPCLFARVGAKEKGDIGDNPNPSVTREPFIS